MSFLEKQNVLFSCWKSGQSVERNDSFEEWQHSSIQSEGRQVLELFHLESPWQDSRLARTFFPLRLDHHGFPHGRYKASGTNTINRCTSLFSIAFLCVGSRGSKNSNFIFVRVGARTHAMFSWKSLSSNTATRLFAAAAASGGEQG
jgi:hypothetical protein